MSMTVPNTHPDKPVVTLFGRLDDGSFAAELMKETSVPYAPYWENAIEQVMVYIEPEPSQLNDLVGALNAGRLEFSALQEFGSVNGGTSAIPI